MERTVFVIYIVLVHLVSEQKEVILVSEANDVLNVGARQYLAGRITRINRHQHARVALSFALVQGTFQLVYIQGPLVILVEVVADLSKAEFRERRGIQRILRNWDQHTGRFAVDLFVEQFQE